MRRLLSTLLILALLAPSAPRAAVTGIPAGLILIQRQTVSGAATMDFTTGINSRFDEYEIHLVNCLPANNLVVFQMRFSDDGGATFKSGAFYNWTSLNSAGSASSGTIATEITLATNQNNTANTVLHAVLRIHAPSTAGTSKLVSWHRSYVNSAPQANATTGTGYYTADTNALNGIRFLYSAGNIASCTGVLYGVRRS